MIDIVRAMPCGVMLLFGVAYWATACTSATDNDCSRQCADPLSSDLVAVEVQEGVFQPANYGCGPFAVEVSTMPIDACGTSTLWPSEQTLQRIEYQLIGVFDDLSLSSQIFDFTTSATGNFCLPLAVGTRNLLHWSASYARLDTHSLYVRMDITQDSVQYDPQIVLKMPDAGFGPMPTLEELASSVGLELTTGRGVFIGRVVDCDNMPVQHAIATISLTSSRDMTCPNSLSGAPVYYFSNVVQNLLQPRDLQYDTYEDALIFIPSIAPTTGADRYYVQAWGFLTQDDLTTGCAGLKLLSEFEFQMPPDTVVLVDMFPTEGPL